MSSVLALALPCSRCGAGAGDPCVRRDGGPLKQPHTGRTPRSLCGTYGGYQQHKLAGEGACDPCREAMRRYMADYRNRRPDVRARDIAQLNARRAATKRLIELHRDEFRRLLKEEAS